MQRLVTISRPLIASPNGRACGCRTTARAPSAIAWPMRLPVRPQVLSSSLMMFLRTSQRTTALARGSCTGSVEIFGTMMLCEFMVQALLQILKIFPAVGASLLAIAVGQSPLSRLTLRYREQACSHKEKRGRQLNP
ncbi:hypothetical protein EMIT0P12_70169 [Pseudomonas sp. IT-P12]